MCQVIQAHKTTTGAESRRALGSLLAHQQRLHLQGYQSRGSSLAPAVQDELQSHLWLWGKEGLTRALTTERAFAEPALPKTQRPWQSLRQPEPLPTPWQHVYSYFTCSTRDGNVQKHSASKRQVPSAQTSFTTRPSRPRGSSR